MPRSTAPDELDPLPEELKEGARLPGDPIN
ncbi:hypothetical protein ElP_40800 [Tautonia plasticadhaerens]|uniref:Uncharacterized protein n=1 Tax=Tautonia plasticadhaerens TaxID=2527974 RepID=A0A518H5Q5_9BACT|nr:hypothetical protein ElP_40800 [Tautonia plasticadhaerens]